MRTELGKYRKTILRSPLFTGCGETDISDLFSDETLKVKEYPNGAFLMQRDSEEHALGILLKGSAVVKRKLTDGQMHMSRLSESDLFGAASLFTKEKSAYVVDIQCVTGCKALILSEAQLLKWMQRNATVLENYLRYLNGRIRFLNQRLDALTHNSVPMKLMAHLANVAEDGTVTVKSYMELAETLSLSRATMYRALDTLCEEGKILREGKKITILEEL